MSEPRYTIMVRKNGSDFDAELCRVASNPEAIAAKARDIRISRSRPGKSVRRYTHVWIKEGDD